MRVMTADQFRAIEALCLQVDKLRETMGSKGNA